MSAKADRDAVPSTDGATVPVERASVPADRASVPLDGASVPRLGRGVRLRVDRVNQKVLLLRPEQGFELRGSALDVVQLCDGRRSVDQIVARLLQAFASNGGASVSPGGEPPRLPAPTLEPLNGQITNDVRELLLALAARRLIELGP